MSSISRKFNFLQNVYCFERLNKFVTTHFWLTYFKFVGALDNAFPFGNPILIENLEEAVREKNKRNCQKFAEEFKVS